MKWNNAGLIVGGMREAMKSEESFAIRMLWTGTPLLQNTGTSSPDTAVANDQSETRCRFEADQHH